MSEKPKVLKSKTKKVYKSNKLNKANFADFNLNDYRVYLNAIALVGGVTAQGKYIQLENPSREYKLSALDFAQQFNIAPNNAYKILKQAVKKLMKTDITIEKPELFQTWQINVCERAVYNEKAGSIDIMFTGSIMDYLKQRTKNFTLYNLNEVADLTSIYSVRLYELMQQFNTTSGMLIHTIEQWRALFGLTTTQYPLYANLKAKVFSQAMEEINLKTGYNLIMSEIKEGRRVIRVQFDFSPAQVQEVMDTRTGEMTTRHRKPRAKKLTVEENAKLEAKRAKEKEYRDRHKAKKMSKLEHDPLTCGCRGGYCEIVQGFKMDKEWAEQLQEQKQEAPEVHPDQQELEL